MATHETNQQHQEEVQRQQADTVSTMAAALTASASTTSLSSGTKVLPTAVSFTKPLAGGFSFELEAANGRERQA